MAYGSERVEQCSASSPVACRQICRLDVKGGGVLQLVVRIVLEKLIC
jgi:hypothetical protein